MNFEDNAEQYEVFPDVVGTPFVIGEGVYNQVLAISKRHVAKVPIEPTYDLEQEYRNHIELYHAEISVPKPIGIFRFYPKNYLGEWGLGLIMEKLNGVRGDKTIGERRTRVTSELDKQLDLCLEAGFEPFDVGLHNCIWNEKAGKLYLIDFYGWKMRN